MTISSQLGIRLQEKPFDFMKTKGLDSKIVTAFPKKPTINKVIAETDFYEKTPMQVLKNNNTSFQFSIDEKLIDQFKSQIRICFNNGNYKQAKELFSQCQTYLFSFINLQKGDFDLNDSIILKLKTLEDLLDDQIGDDFSDEKIDQKDHYLFYKLYRMIKFSFKNKHYETTLKNIDLFNSYKPSFYKLEFAYVNQKIERYDKKIKEMQKKISSMISNGVSKIPRSDSIYFQITTTDSKRVVITPSVTPNAINSPNL